MTLTEAGRRILLAATCAGLLAVSGSITLLSRVDDRLDEPMSRGTQGRAVPLLETAGPLPPVYVLRLHTDDSTALLAYQEIHILFNTGAGRATLVEATVDVAGVPCRFAAPDGTRLTDNALVRFVRSMDCRAAGAPTGELRLTVRLSERARVGVWTWLADAGASAAAPAIRVIGIPGHSGAALILRGRYLRSSQPSAFRRVDLLNHVWGLSPSPTWIWLALGAACGAVLMGAFLWLTVSESSRWATVVCSSATFLVAAGIAGGYALLTPPFQAADEPDHFLSFARLSGDQVLVSQAADWARLGHLERIRFQSDERFRPRDVGQPYSTAWSNETFAEDVTARSATTARWWQWLRPLTAGRSAPWQLLIVRLANVWLFALCTALAAAILRLSAGGGVPESHVLAGTSLLVPILSFFAMPVSEFAVLCSVYVLLAACLAGLTVDAPHASWLGAPLGIVVALIAASGRSALPMLPIVAAALLARVLLGQRQAAGDWVASCRFWLGLTAGFAAVTLWLRPEYPEPIDRFPAIARETLLPLFRTIWNSPWILGGAGLFGLAAERLASAARRRLPWATVRAVRMAAAGGCYVVAAAVIGSFLVSWWVRFPQLRPLTVPPSIPVGEYVTEVLTVALTAFRLSHHDLFLAASFVGGFGWVDTLPGETFVTMLVVATGAAVVALSVLLAQRRDTRRIFWIACLGAGWICTLVLYAIATHGMSRNLHGRYLTGAYLCVLAIIGVGAVLTRGPQLQRLRLPALLLACGIIHAYCYRLILVRYF